MIHFSRLKRYELVVLTLYLLWLALGTLFYSYQLDIGLLKGFYMAINVGYNIGWQNIPENRLGTMWFSVFYLAGGLFFIGAALRCYAKQVVRDRDNWFTREISNIDFYMDLQKFEGSGCVRGFLWGRHNWKRFKPFLLWASCIALATLFSLGLTDNYYFIESFYFSLSTISGGGMIEMPSEAKDWEFFMTGLYVVWGVPLTVITIAMIVSYVNSQSTLSKVMKKLQRPVREEEFEMLDGFDMKTSTLTPTPQGYNPHQEREGEGESKSRGDLNPAPNTNTNTNNNNNTKDKESYINKSEFVLLCLIRLGTNEELVRLITDYHSELDVDKSGLLHKGELNQLLNTSDLFGALDKAQQRRGLPKNFKIPESGLGAGLGFTRPPSAEFSPAAREEMEVEMGDIYAAEKQ